MKYILIIISLLSFSVCSAHPVYVSIFHIGYDTESEELQISIRVFTDDLEAAMEMVQKQPIILSENLPDSSSERLSNFLNAQLEFRQLETIRPVTLVGMEFKPDVCWIHCRVNDVSKEDLVNLTTRWLYKYKSSQSNIVYLKTGHDEENHILVQDDNKLSFSLLE